MKKGIVWFLLLLLVLLPVLANNKSQNDCFYYFYGQGCPHCGAISLYLEQLQYKYPSLQIKSFEVYYDKANWQSLQKYFEAYGVPLEKQGVPAVFYSENYFIGSQSIEKYLENSLLSSHNPNCPTLDQKGAVGVVGAKSPKSLIETLTFITVTGAALVDSINPCAIAVLLILLGTLVAADNKRRVFWAGIAFITAIYLSYLLFGLGILSTLKITGISYYFYKAVGVMAIVIGLLNIKDYFWYGKIFLMEIPLKWRPKLKKLIQNATSPASAFILGFIVTLFELPCTGGPYLVILGLLAEKATKWAALSWLLYYNLVFILPLIVILLVIYFSTRKIEDQRYDPRAGLENWRQKNLRVLHLVTGIVMIVLGLVTLFYL